VKTILFNCPYYHGPAAIRWIVASWEAGFMRRGYRFVACEDVRELQPNCERLKPDILFCDVVSTPIEEASCRDILAKARSDGSKICMNVFWPLYQQPEERAKALAEYDIANLYCGEREPDSMETFEIDTGKQYVTLPQSANPRYHFPDSPDPRYNYDVVFLGAKLPHKRWFNEKVLAPLRRRYRVGLFGPGWSIQDNALRALSKTARILDCLSWARRFDDLRFLISDEDERRLYASAKIALNFHEREPDNSQPHHIVNQRTFKIAACGGFQIVDPVAALPKYFSADEIVTAAFDPQEWFDKVEYYIAHDEERRAIQKKATARALNEHMSQHRVDRLERLLGLSSS